MDLKDLITKDELGFYNQNEFMKDLEIFLKLIFATGTVKGEGYKNSWCKRGELVGVWGNATRKTDRIENILNDLQEFGQVKISEENLLDTIIDTSVYYPLWSTLRIILRNVSFLVWLDKDDNIRIKEKFVSMLNEEQMKRWNINKAEEI